jgi:uncharacterized protein YqiB (DUF1249 family)
MLPFVRACVTSCLLALSDLMYVEVAYVMLLCNVDYALLKLLMPYDDDDDDAVQSACRVK